MNDVITMFDAESRTRATPPQKPETDSKSSTGCQRGDVPFGYDLLLVVGRHDLITKWQNARADVETATKQLWDIRAEEDLKLREVNEQRTKQNDVVIEEFDEIKADADGTIDRKIDEASAFNGFRIAAGLQATIANAALGDVGYAHRPQPTRASVEMELGVWDAKPQTHQVLELAAVLGFGAMYGVSLALQTGLLARASLLTNWQMTIAASAVGTVVLSYMKQAIEKPFFNAGAAGVLRKKSGPQVALAFTSLVGFGCIEIAIVKGGISAANLLSDMKNSTGGSIVETVDSMVLRYLVSGGIGGAFLVNAAFNGWSKGRVRGIDIAYSDKVATFIEEELNYEARWRKQVNDLPLAIDGRIASDVADFFEKEAQKAQREAEFFRIERDEKLDEVAGRCHDLLEDWQDEGHRREQLGYQAVLESEESLRSVEAEIVETLRQVAVTPKRRTTSTGFFKHIIAWFKQLFGGSK
ncbi:MAG: hypothetical protein JST12_08935 [Armatimonadetes bacterium]|nr:hypothetical protein [Armatimonadota bacterium]